jgi:hypothetical protein
MPRGKKVIAAVALRRDDDRPDEFLAARRIERNWREHLALPGGVLLSHRRQDIRVPILEVGLLRGIGFQVE